MAKRKDEGLGCLLLILIGGIIYLWSQNTIWGIVALIIGLVLFFVAAIVVAIPKTCDVCNAALKRASYSWKLDGKNQRVCPNCNRSLERKTSRAALKKKKLI